MDTKSKKFSYSIILKVICFLLACVFAAAGTVSAVNFAADFYQNGAAYSDALAETEYSSVEQTYSFSEICRRHLSAIMLKCVYFKDASQEAFKNSVKNSIDREYRRRYEYYMSTDVSNLENLSFATLEYICDGNFSYENSGNRYFTFDGKPIEVPKDADRIYYSNDKIYSVKLDKKAIYEEVCSDLSQSFYRHASQNEKIYSSIKNLRFAVINSTDKTFYTNVETLSQKSSAAELNKYFSSFNWNFYMNSEGKTSFSQNIEPDRSHQQSQAAGLFGYYEQLSSDLIIDSVKNAVSSYMSDEYDWSYEGYSSSDRYEIYVSFDEKMSAGEDEYVGILSKIDYASKNIVSTAIIFSVCSAGVLAALIYLTVTAGRKEKGGEVKLVATDRIFSFLHLAFDLAVFAVCLIIVLILLKSYCTDGIHVLHKNLVLGLSGLFAVIGFSSVTEGLMSFSRNVKNRSFFKNTLVGHIVFNNHLRSGSNQNGICKSNIVLLIGCIYTFLLAFFSMLTAWEDWFVIPLLMLVIFGCVFVLISAYHIAKLIEQLQDTDGAHDENTIDPKKYPLWLRGLADYIVKMQNNTKTAVESAIKDQKMKTQLITNVSHDLKTPLTAVINYSDLLSKCEIDNEEAREYVAIINEKCDRLKKLIEDLTDAAKASSGNVQANIVVLNLNEIAVQIAGETEDSLNSKNLELVLNIPEKPVVAAADSKLTYRILENLMSNVQKYAMPNTRVYISVGEDKSISISNISEKALNISPDELKERFVRGDESRTTEGSGLGLAIADDLCRIQGGKLDIAIDGDLFKVTVAFETE